MPVEVSAYYPPRARWYSPVFSLGDRVRRRLALDRVALPGEMRLSELLAGFLVPGLAIWLRGSRPWGQAALAGSAVLMMVFIVWLGFPAANIAFGLLISLHTTGLVFYCSPLMADEPFQRRLAFTFLVLLAISLLLYMPARSFILGHYVTPLRMNGHVIVVRRGLQPQELQRGDWVAYHFDESAVGRNYHGGTVRMQNGVSLGAVLARPGDRVVFSTNSFSVNGNVRKNLPHMPPTGELVVPENHWFIWPNLGISQYGNVGEARISLALLGLADVPETNFFGKPLHRWFWRKQALP